MKIECQEIQKRFFFFSFINFINFINLLKNIFLARFYNYYQEVWTLVQFNLYKYKKTSVHPLTRFKLQFNYLYHCKRHSPERIEKNY